MSVDEKWRALEEENTRLRNSLISSNDEIFTLRAVAASVEAEIKYSAEQELTKIGSELKFRSKELESLSKEHERVLRELKQLRQQEAENRNRVAAAPPPLAHDSSGHSQSSSAESASSQPSRTVWGQSALQRNSADPNKAPVGSTSSGWSDAGHSRPVSPRPVDTSRSTLPTQPTVTHLMPLYTPPSVVPKPTFSTILSAQFEQLLCIVAQASPCVGDSVDLERSVSRATGAVRIAAVQAQSSGQLSVMLDAFDAILCLGAVFLRNVRSGFQGQGNARSLGKVVSALEQTMTVLDTLAPSSLLTGRKRRDGGSETEVDPRRLAGSLQSKFERAATTTAAQSSTAKQGTTALRPPSDLVSAALVLPALTEVQIRLAVSAADSGVGMSSDRDFDTSNIAQLSGRYSEILSGVCALCGEWLAADEGHDGWRRLFITAARAATSFYRDGPCLAVGVLGNSDDVGERPGTQWEGMWGSVLVAATGRFHSGYRVAEAAVQLWQATIQSSDRAMAAFAAWEVAAPRDASSGVRDGEGGKGSILSALVDAIAAPLQGDLCDAIGYRCTVVQCFLLALEHGGPAFVRVFLGISDASTTAQSSSKGRQQSTSRRKRTRADEAGDGEEGEARAGEGGEDTSSMHSGHSESSSSDLTRIVAAGEGTARAGLGGAEQTGSTPVPARKAGSRLGRQDSTLGDTTGAAVGAVARITPSTHGSGGRSGRKVAPAVIVVDLQGQLGRVDKRHLTRCMRSWMRAVRCLDTCAGTRPLSETERQVVRLTHLLGNFLGAFLDHLKPQDCDEVLSEAADVVHEYIHRCNTASWSPVLKVSESLFAFLESRQHESSA